MSIYSKPKKHFDPCKAQLYKTVKLQYYRYPVKYICTPVEWDTKCEKHVYWEPQKLNPPVKVPCEELRPKYYKEEKDFCCKEKQPYKAPEYGYEQDGSYYKEDGYAYDEAEYEEEEDDD